MQPGFGQNIAIKIYLEDAETSKNICDAKVTLEGLEIPEIRGKYDKIGKFYYFTEIPEGYNTVMAYHEKYNEKGFQDVKGLTRNIRLKLYKPYRIKFGNNFYKEDDKKLVINFNEEEFVNKEVCIKGYYKCYIENYFPELEIIQRGSFPSFSNSIMVIKRNNTAFKRFNDPIIKKLNEDKNILGVYGLMLKTVKSKKMFFLEDGTAVFSPVYRRYTDADYVINRYNIWNNTHYEVKNKYNYEKIKEYYYFLTENNITSNVVVKIDEELKKSILENRDIDLYQFSTYTGDTLISVNSNIFKNANLYSPTNNIIKTSGKYLEEIKDVYDPYIIISNCLGDKEYHNNLFCNHRFTRKLKKLKVVSQEKHYNDICNKFNGIVSPFGALDLFDYYKN